MSNSACLRIVPLIEQMLFSFWNFSFCMSKAGRKDPFLPFAVVNNFNFTVIRNFRHEIFLRFRALAGMARRSSWLLKSRSSFYHFYEFLQLKSLFRNYKWL
tara:strand:+ start:2436 stop:2738 length:303 start_codon:yes stop_codon:yes gene_type:complete